MKQLRELTQPGDPMMRIRLPKALHKVLGAAAKKNKRKIPDEVIKRISAMHKEGALFRTVQARLLPELQAIYKK